MPKAPITHSEFIEIFKDAHNIDYSITSQFTKLTEKIRVKHEPCGYEYSIIAREFKSGKGRCPKCSGTLKPTIHEIKERIKTLDSAYTITNKEFVNNKQLLTFVHSDCGKSFEMRLNGFESNSNRCPHCRGLKRKTTEEFKNEVEKLRGEDYEFSGEYVSSRIPAEFLHKSCGKTFKMSPSNFLSGQNCSHCFGIKRRTYDSFLIDIHNRVGDEYTLLSTEYTHDKEKYLFRHNVCKNEFWMRANNFIEGNRCPRCQEKVKDGGEKNVIKFIRTFYDGEIIRQYKVEGSKKSIDIFLPEFNIGIEFNGLIYHSTKYGRGPDYHKNKYNWFSSNGIRLIQIWSDDWNYKNFLVQNKLKHILGYSEETKIIHARKCEVRVLQGNRLKDDFLDRYHLQGKDISKFNYGMFYENELIAVMTFGKPRPALGYKHVTDYSVLELSRFAVNVNYKVNGAFNKIFKFFEKNQSFSHVFTYANLDWSVGEIYEKNGFEKVRHSVPSFWYVHDNGKRRIHRFQFTRTKVKEKFPEVYSDERKVKEVMEIVGGYYRIYNTGNILFRKNGDLSPISSTKNL